MSLETSYVPPYFPLSDEPAPCLLFIHHYNLLSDPRMDSWRRAIEQTVKPGDKVLDLGCGTGILSMIAARAGGEVTGVEIDPHLTDYARHFIRKNRLDNRINIINGDACQRDVCSGADVIICEMLDTGLIKERQVQAMNSILGGTMAPGCRIIPCRVNNFAMLCRTDYDFCGFTLPLPFFETGEVRRTRENLSEAVIYQSLDLSRKNPEQVKVGMKIQANRPGIVNSIKIYSVTQLCPGILCGPSNWFNPPLVLPAEPIEVKNKDILSLRLSYCMGGGLRTLDYEVTAHE